MILIFMFYCVIDWFIVSDWLIEVFSMEGLDGSGGVDWSFDGFYFDLFFVLE